jgi:DNA-directed RNA polymerase specialized sigma24 family protein
MQEFPVKIDALLQPLLTVTSDEHTDELLSQVIAEHAEPVIKGVIRFKLRFNSHQEMQRAEANDIQQDVVLQLVSQLQRFRKLPAAHQITDVRGMAAIIAHRTCARWMRRQNAKTFEGETNVPHQVLSISCLHRTHCSRSHTSARIRQQLRPGVAGGMHQHPRS